MVITPSSLVRTLMLRHGAETRKRKKSLSTESSNAAGEGKIRVLLIHPGFTPNIWTLDGVLPIVGKRAFLPPLGLVTVAALLPATWELRLVDGAVRPPSEADWAWAELVLITGMIVQRDQMLALVREAGSRGRPVVMGGPFVTSVPDLFDAAGADYLVLGEGETVIPELIAHLEAHGARRRDGAALRFDGRAAKPDVTRTPLPRFDLLELDAYLSMSVQYSRGCPFLCEFCDIITLYGRRPRTKSPEQLIAELDLLYRLGWRGDVFVVDDNFIGNRPNVRKMLPGLLRWQEANGFPFEFFTEASIDLSGDEELMRMMVRCGFRTVFIGIETPDEESLNLTLKRQNTREPMTSSIARITGAGLRVTCGMILGFDGERAGAGDRIVRFLEETDIPTVTITVLQALPNTALWDRLLAEGRLTDGAAGMGQDQVCNFTPTRPIGEIITEYVNAYRRVYARGPYLRRAGRHFSRLGRGAGAAPRPLPRLSGQDRVRGLIGLVRIGLFLLLARPERRAFLEALIRVLVRNPGRVEDFLHVCVQLEHFGMIAERVGSELITARD